MNVSLRVHELFEEARISPFFMQTVHSEWKGLEQELEHNNTEGENFDLVDILHSLIDILLGGHVSWGASMIDHVFSLRKVSFVAKVSRHAKISELKLDRHVSTISIELVFFLEAYQNV